MALTLRRAAAHVGEFVTYTNPIDRKTKEIGVIERVDHRVVWVEYESWSTPVATHPDNLTLDRSSR
ncbi:hypothetical protein GS507_18595 [Rhodococcus hoagii]|nr:hypothetical protein [Prescottella equi]